MFIWATPGFKNALDIVDAGEVQFLLTVCGVLIFISTVYVFISCLQKLGELEPRQMKSLPLSFLTIVHVVVIIGALMYLWHYRIMDSQAMDYEMERKLIVWLSL